MARFTVFKRFGRDRRGSVATIMAIATLPLVVATGAAVDFANYYSVKAKVQAALDHAVLAGAAYRNAQDAERVEEATNLFFGNLDQPWPVDVEFAATGDPTRGLVATVSGTASMPVSMAFLGIIGIDTVNLTVEAVARGVVGAPVCMLALSGDADHGVDLQGTSQLNAVNCAVHTNSSSYRALNADGGGRGDAESFCAVGDYVGGGFSPTPFTRCGSIPDPFAHLPVPGSLECDYNNTRFQNGIHTASPGVYCGGIRALAYAQVTLLPGVYVIRDGDLNLQAHSHLEGDGVTFYFYGSGAYLNHHSHAGIDIVAPTVGDYAGVAFVQHWASSVGETSILSGGPNVRVVGSVYLPTQALQVAGGGDFATISPYMPMIAARFIISGNGLMTVQVDHEAAGYEDQLVHIAGGVLLLR